MKTNGGFLVTKIKQLGDRIFEKILSEKNIDAFNGAQGLMVVLAGLVCVLMLMVREISDLFDLIKSLFDF